MLKPKQPLRLNFIVPGNYFVKQATHKYCAAKRIRYPRDSCSRRVASMIYVVVETNVNVQINDEGEYESATVTGFIVGQSKQDNRSLDLSAEEIVARECRFVGTQINVSLALQSVDGFPNFYNYMFFGYDHVLQRKMDMCSDVLKASMQMTFFHLRYVNLSAKTSPRLL